jgi:hypothetical protein
MEGATKFCGKPVVRRNSPVSEQNLIAVSWKGTKGPAAKQLKLFLEVPDCHPDLLWRRLPKPQINASDIAVQISSNSG